MEAIVDFFEKFPIYFHLLIAAGLAVAVYAFVMNISKYRAIDSKLVKTNALWGMFASVMILVMMTLAYLEIWGPMLMVFAFTAVLGLLRMGEIKKANQEYKRLTKDK